MGWVAEPLWGYGIRYLMLWLQQHYQGKTCHCSTNDKDFEKTLYKKKHNVLNSNTFDSLNQLVFNIFNLPSDLEIPEQS